MTNKDSVKRIWKATCNDDGTVKYPVRGQMVYVLGGEYDGCILAFKRYDKATGYPICKHQDIPGGVMVPKVVACVA
jgi:hypothetical protein